MPTDPIRLTADDIRRACDKLTCDPKYLQHYDICNAREIIESHERVKAVLALLSPDGTPLERAKRAVTLLALLGFDASLLLKGSAEKFMMHFTPSPEPAP